MQARKTINRSVPFLATLGLLYLAGCGNSHYRKGRSALDDGAYQRAIVELTLAVSDRPNVPEYYRELGVAFFHLRKFDQAIVALNHARRLIPNDGRTLFYLGYSHELQHDYAAAINVYTEYRKGLLFDQMNQQIQARVTQLSLKLAELEVDKALRLEQERYLAPPAANTLAVIYFRNVSERTELNPLLKGLAAILITDLAKLQDVQLVERNKLEVLLQEISLSTSALYDQFSAPRAGRVLGAERVVVGGATAIGTTGLQLDAGVVRSASSQLVGKTVRVSGRISDILQLEKQLVFALIDQLGIRVSETEREAIQRLPTNSTLAFVAYSQGLAFTDSLKIPQAQQALQRAVTLDPNFSAAQELLTVLNTPVLASGQLLGLAALADATEMSAAEQHLSAIDGALQGGPNGTGPLIPPASRGRIVVSGKLP